MGPSEFRRDGQILSAPDYGGDDTDADQRDDVVEGELAPPATMIGHETVAIEEPEPAVVERAMRVAQHEHRNGVTPSRIVAMQRSKPSSCGSTTPRPICAKRLASARR